MRRPGRRCGKKRCWRARLTWQWDKKSARCWVSCTSIRLSIIEPFSDHTVYVQLRVDPFYRRVQERRPEVAKAIEPIIERMLTTKEAICHGDYTPKNILVHDQGFTLVDYETAHFGDPTMDIGLCLAHIILKAVRRPALLVEYFALTRAFWRGYKQMLELAPLKRWEAQGIDHFAVCL